MNFVKYPSLENHYREKFLFNIECSDAMNCDWVATEKLHGANFSLWTDGEDVKAARRSGFIPEDESFYGSAPVVEHYTPLLKELAQSMPMNKLILFGELVGEGIQKGVNYCDGKDFYVFDVATLDEGELVFLDYTETLVNTLHEAGFKTSPILKQGTYQEVIALENLFNSTFGNFTAEGYVAKPVVSHTLPNGSRAIIKSKNSKFSEKKTPTKGSQVQIPDTVKQHVIAAEGYITDNRLNNVESKEGKVEQKLFGKFLGLLIADAVDDYIKDNDLEIEKADIKAVKKLLQPTARDLIKTRL